MSELHIIFIFTDSVIDWEWYGDYIPLLCFLKRMDISNFEKGKRDDYMDCEETPYTPNMTFK